MGLKSPPASCGPEMAGEFTAPSNGEGFKLTSHRHHHHSLAPLLVVPDGGTPFFDKNRLSMLQYLVSLL